MHELEDMDYENIETYTCYDCKAEGDSCFINFCEDCELEFCYICLRNHDCTR